MTKNRSIKIAVLVLALALITSCFVGTTFAKYTSSATVTDAVEVAKWQLQVNGDNFEATDAETFDLFATTIYGYDTGDNEQLATQDAEVVAGMIAPGTSGKGVIKVDNLSDVKAAVSVTLTETVNKYNVPIEYAVVAGTGAAPDAESADWKASASGAIGTFELGTLNYTDGTATYTIYWRWDFEGEDTDIGIAAREVATDDIQVTAVITATQVN